MHNKQRGAMLRQLTELLQERCEPNAMGERTYTTTEGKKVVLQTVAGYPSLDFRTAGGISYSPSDTFIQQVINELS